MLRRFSANFALFSMFLDGTLVILSLWVATQLRPVLNRLPGIEFIASPVVTPFPLYILFPVLWIIIFSIISIYDGRKHLRVVDEFTALTIAMLFASISAAGILYVSFRDVSRALFLVFIIFLYLTFLFWRILARWYYKTKNIFADRSHRILIVGAGSLGGKIREQLLETRASDIVIVGFVDSDADLIQDSDILLDKPEKIKDIVSDEAVSDVVIALPHSSYDQIGNIVQSLEEIHVQVWVALDFFEITLYSTAIEDLAGIPMLDLRASAITEYQRMMKRTLDVMLGVVLLLLALPAMALSALMIFIEDGRPILFRQERVGENGRLFEILKFRTMIKNAEQLRGLVEKRDPKGNLIHKPKDDPRVTQVGRILRRFSLDELPQLFNVLRGDMSLVGPRPELPYLVEKYQPWQRRRFSVPPGLTGWWQVRGRSDRPMHLHTEDDLHYIQNYSILLDIEILLRTAWVVILGKGSF